jgi:cation/acetate symporter
VLIIAYLIPVTVLSFKYTGNPISQISYGFALQGIEQKFAQLKDDSKEKEVREIHKKKAEELKAKIAALPQSWEEGKKQLQEKLASLAPDDPKRAELEKQLKDYPKSPEEAKEKWTQAMKDEEAASKPPKSYVTPPSDAKGMANFLALTLMLMLGTAGLPHIIMRFYTTPTVREARTSAGWALFFILLLYITAPAYAAFGRYEMLNLVGKAFSEMPSWVEKWAKVGLITIKDLNGDGIIQFAEIKIHPDMVVLATPEIAGLPYVIAGFVAAGGLAAALSTADGLLITISNAISHDLYYKIINPNLAPSTRVKIGKALLLVVALIGAYVASFRLAIIVELVAWAFSLAGASLFPALVLGIWDKRTNKYGAVAGILGRSWCNHCLPNSQQVLRL